MAEVEDPTPPKHPGAREKKREKEIWSTRKGKSVRSLPPPCFCGEGGGRMREDLLLLRPEPKPPPPQSLHSLIPSPPFFLGGVLLFFFFSVAVINSFRSPVACPTPPYSSLSARIQPPLGLFHAEGGGRNGGCCVTLSLRKLSENIRPGTPESTLHAVGAKCSS